MATRRKFRSPISEAVIEGISGLYRLGLVDEAGCVRSISAA